MSLMKAQTRGLADEALMPGQEGDCARGSTHPVYVCIEIVGTYQVSDFECCFDVPTRTVKIYEANVRRLGQCDADLLRECPGEGAGDLECETLVNHSDRVRSFKFEGCRTRRPRR